MNPPQRDIVYRKSISAWSEASPNIVLFDFSLTPYNLDFTPDAFYVKTVAYISKSEQNANSGVPALTCAFASNTNSVHVLGVMSAAGSISHPNTLHEYLVNKGGELGQTCAFTSFLLTSSGTVAPGQLSASTWMVVLEFIQYVDTI